MHCVSMAHFIALANEICILTHSQEDHLPHSRRLLRPRGFHHRAKETRPVRGLFKTPPSVAVVSLFTAQCGNVGLILITTPKGLLCGGWATPVKINLHAGRAGERLNAGRAEGARSGLSRRRVIMGV